MKVEINNRKKTEKLIYIRKLNNTLLRRKVSRKKSQGESGNNLEQMPMRMQHTKTYEVQ